MKTRHWIGLMFVAATMIAAAFLPPTSPAPRPLTTATKTRWINHAARLQERVHHLAGVMNVTAIRDSLVPTIPDDPSERFLMRPASHVPANVVEYLDHRLRAQWSDVHSEGTPAVVVSVSIDSSVQSVGTLRLRSSSRNEVFYLLPQTASAPPCFMIVKMTGSHPRPGPAN